MEWINLADTLQPRNLYRYNGKEMIEEMDLNLAGYGARYYDAVIGRFINVDPLAEKYPGMTPYNYVGNNPINNIDIRGDSITPVGANQHLQMGIINWDRGVSAGNGYTLYGGTGTNSSGAATQMWVARQDVGDGMHRDDYVMDVTDVKEFRDNSSKYKTLSNIVNTFENGGQGLWDGYKSTWTPENILIGATIIGGALKSPKGPVTNELYVRPNT
ncbi:MAG: RHS repeat-associated core domain-containing protein [Saprospiraceae bacterium]|nr:RHS repeat-associated core domain-containing protein [Saprospiraceae bacterium]